MSLATETIKAPKVSRLEKSARTLLAKAEASLGAYRLTNTRKRAEEAAQASRRAQREILRANTALRICEGASIGANVTALSQVEYLEGELGRAVWNFASKNNIRGDRHSEIDERDAADIARMPNDSESTPTLKALGIEHQNGYRSILRELATLRRQIERPAEDPVRALERQLVGFTAPGFFPTPKPLANRMALLAGCAPGIVVLEPSAGSGRLADAAKERGARVDCGERNHTLVALLRAKGHEVDAGDFLTRVPEPVYGAVLMNPPFEDGQDALHICHAWGFVRPGGILVAISGEGIWFRQDRIATDFRGWIESLGSALFHDEMLPSGTFNASDVTQRTNVAARLIGIRKAAS